MTMDVGDIGLQFPVLPPIPPAKLKDIYNGRKKKTLNGKRRWFEIFRRKKRNDPEAHAILKEKELECETAYIDVPELENQEDGPDPTEMTALAKQKVKNAQVTTSGVGFKSRASKSVKTQSTPGSDDVVKSDVSGDGDVMTEVPKPPHETYKDRNNVKVTWKPPVAPRKSSKVRRSSVPDTTMVAKDDKEDGSRPEKETTADVKETEELEKPAKEVDAVVEEVQNSTCDTPSVEPVKRLNRPLSSKNKDAVLEGLDKLLDSVDQCKESSATTKPRPRKHEYTDDVLDGLEELMDDVYYNR